MAQVTIDNVYDFVTYEYDLDKSVLWVKWDKYNEEVENIMKNEGYQSSREKRGFCWVQILKTITNWKEGDIINIITIYPRKGQIYIKWSYADKISAHHIIVGTDGYFYKRDYTLAYIPLVKIDCLYNEF
jgi:hypothetical protein